VCAVLTYSLLHFSIFSLVACLIFLNFFLRLALDRSLFLVWVIVSSFRACRNFLSDDVC
jgi:hypothetical protein